MFYTYHNFFAHMKYKYMLLSFFLFFFFEFLRKRSEVPKSRNSKEYNSLDIFDRKV